MNDMDRVKQVNEQATKVKVENISYPDGDDTESNDPEVEVVVRIGPEVIERYQFEIHRHELGGRSFCILGSCTTTEGAAQSDYRNEAGYKAAKALAELTDRYVLSVVHPTSVLKKRENETE
jgi:hypothetical protein